MFQWLPKEYGWTIPEKYLDRLNTWAKREPQRQIKLVINRSGFTPKQLKELKGKLLDKTFNPNQNIDIIDFNNLDLKEYDFSFHLQHERKIKQSECPEYTVSKYFKDLYSIQQDKRLSFGVEIEILCAYLCYLHLDFLQSTLILMFYFLIIKFLSIFTIKSYDIK
ncbi:hypothetical protein [Wolbachia endosymbiont of Pentidionis agamae]|uniref:hypothetical protein n=1 Tax=Wolbachia endosymbiont of Pentidionis agamae TaxID=3110435 RepID=UPI002FCF9143